MQNFLANHTAVVTGGTQGIGWAMVQALADHGAQVYACGYSAGSLAQAEAERAALPRADAIHLTRCDVTDRAAYESWLHAIHAATGRVDILIHNAAFVRWADVADMTVDEAQRTMRVGYDAMVFGTNTVLPWMLAQNSGTLVNIGSVAGKAFVGGSSAAYAAVKAAIDAYTQTLQVELRGTAVSATIIRLGTVGGTDFFKKHVSNERMPPFMRFVPALTPPDVATAVIRAIHRRQQIVTLPRYLGPLLHFYSLFPRTARAIARLGGRDNSDYAGMNWK